MPAKKYTSRKKTRSRLIYRTLVAFTNDRELKNNVLASQLLVNLSEGINLIVDTRTFLSVEEDLDDLVTVLLSADALADNLGGEDEVMKDGVVDSSKSPGARALLGNARSARREGENAALSNKEDMAVREFLLELTS